MEVSGYVLVSGILSGQYGAVSVDTWVTTGIESQQYLFSLW